MPGITHHTLPRGTLNTSVFYIITDAGPHARSAIDWNNDSNPAKVCGSAIFIAAAMDGSAAAIGNFPGEDGNRGSPV